MWLELVQRLQPFFAETSESFNYRLKASDLHYRSAQNPSPGVNIWHFLLNVGLSLVDASCILYIYKSGPGKTYSQERAHENADIKTFSCF